MSRSSVKRLELVLLPTQCRVLGDGAPRVHPVDEGLPTWPDQLLAEIPAKAHVHAVISDALLRYLVVRWPRTLRSRTEREAWLAHQFRQTHEIDPAQWRVVADEDAVDSAFIACAMPRRLEADLRTLLDRVGARLVSLTGQFIRQYNAHCHRLGDGQGALAVIDASRITLGTWQNGHWTRLASQPVAAADSAAAARALAQLKVTGEAAAAGVLYVCGGQLEAPAGWTSSTLEMA